MTPEQIAPIVHEAIRGMQKACHQNVSPSWDEATWEKDSTIDNVKLAMTSPTPGQAHQNWMEERLAQGWTYGEVRDNDFKTNPSLVPFDKLPDYEKAKDSIVISLTSILRDVQLPAVA